MLFAQLYFNNRLDSYPARKFYTSNKSAIYTNGSFHISEHQLWVSYSICRNFYHICDSSKCHRQTAKDLRFFDGLRAIGVFLVLFVHSLILFMTVQVDNPEFYERFFYRPENAIIENGAAIIQIFFVMSGFLLYVNFNERNFVTTDTSLIDCVIIYFKIFFHRYLR